MQTKGTIRRLDEATGTFTAAAMSAWKMLVKPQVVTTARQPWRTISRVHST